MPKRPSKASAQNGKKEIDQASLDFFLSSISDPQEPGHCGRCLYGALLAFTANARNPDDTPFKLPLVLRRNVEFWSKLFAFLVAIRTDTQVEELLHRFSNCKCNLSDGRIRGYHQAAERAETGSIQRLWLKHYAPQALKPSFTNERIAFVIKMITLLYAGLSDIGVKSVAKGTVQTWPTTPSDLIPFGADNLVQTLLQWYRFIPDTIIFQVAARIMHVCQVVIIPSLSKFKFTHCVVETARNLADFTLEENNTRRVANSPQALLESAVSLTFRYNYTMDAVIQYFREIMENMPTDCRTDLFFGCETKAIQIFSMHLYISSDPQMIPHPDHENIMRYCAVHCQQLYRFFHMHLYPHPDYPVFPSVVELDRGNFPPPASVRSVPSGAAFYIRKFREEIRCSAYCCPNSIQSAGKNFQRCSRCQIVPYCGRECQIRAWRDEKYPHKRVCPILRHLVDTAGGMGMFVPTETPPVFAYVVGGTANHHLVPLILENWEAAGVPHDMLECIFDWARWIDSTKNMPDGSWWTPGYDDYNEVIRKLSVPLGRGPQREFSAEVVIFSHQT